MRDWDDEFANMKHVAGSDKLQAFWAAEGACLLYTSDAADE